MVNELYKSEVVMSQEKMVNFEDKLAKIIPTIIREVVKRQKTIFAHEKLSLTHVVILELLLEKTRCSMSELTRGLDLTMSAVTGVVDKMVSLGLVKREHSKEDRRIVEVFLTSKGEQSAKEVTNVRKKAIKSMYSVLTDKEKALYLSLLGKVYSKLREDDSEG